MNTMKLRKQASNLVIAIALATGTAMVAGHIVPDEAQAQRTKKKKKKKGDEQQAPQPEYSKEWREAFVPLNEQLNAEGADPNAFSAQIEQLVSLTKSADEQLQTGQLIYNAGVRAGKSAQADAAKQAALLQRLRGMEFMVGSNKAPAAAAGQYNYIAFQLSSVVGQHEKSRGYLRKAMELNYSGQTQSEMMVALAQTYFNTDEYPQGLAVLDEALAAKKTAGEEVDERLYEIAFSVAYREDIQPQVYDYAITRAQMFPTDENWTNAINVVRVLNDYNDQTTLDILRLSRMAGVMSDKQEFLIYVESADARRLPQEVKDVIEQGYASGAIEQDDSFIAEQLRIATDRIETDREELPVLAQDARAADATLATVRAAGSAFLSYGEYDKAVEFYQKTLSMPGVDTAESLTRMGIAQVGMEDYAGALETFGKITGERAPIAKVWAGYAAFQNAEMTGG
ncbi:MAG: hypothetical protein HRT64_05850 [Erythrobacter sp.]|nr:hypothetical protein [Erythrobacter sp.]